MTWRTCSRYGRRHGIEADRFVVGRQDHREIPAQLRIVDVAHLVAAEGQRPVLGVNSDPVDLARLVGGDDEPIVVDAAVAVPSAERLRRHSAA